MSSIPLLSPLTFEDFNKIGNFFEKCSEFRTMVVFCNGMSLCANRNYGMTLVGNKNIIQHLWEIHWDEYKSYQIWNSTGCVSIQQFNHIVYTIYNNIIF